MKTCVYAIFDNASDAPKYLGSIRAASRLDAIHYGAHYWGAVLPVAVRLDSFAELAK